MGHNKVLLIFLVIASFLVTLYYLNSYRTLHEKNVVEGRVFTISTNEEISQRVDSLIFTLKVNVLKTVTELEAKPKQALSEIDYLNFCQKMTDSITSIQSVSIAYESFKISDSISLFLSHYSVKTGELTKMPSEVDYRDTSMLSNQWYTKVRESKADVWLAPYYDEIEKKLVTGYAHPIMFNNEFVGVVCFKLAINELIDTMHKFSLGKGGFVFLVNTEGKILAHPDPELVFKQDIYEILNYDPIIDSVLARKTGFVERYKSPKRGELAFAFKLLDNQQWMLVTVFSTKDLYENNTEIKRNLINLFTSFTVFVSLFLFWFILRHGITQSEAWTFCTYLTIVFIINIGYLWYLNWSDHYRVNETSDYLADEATKINQFVIEQNLRRKSFDYPELIQVPTGVVIEKIKFLDSYNVGLSGWLWQKFPKKVSYVPNIHFSQLSPFAEADYLELVETIDKGDYIFTKWRFRSTFIFNFDYLKYPFNTKTVKLKLGHPDFESNVLFVPDIEGYESLSPSSLPGISKNSQTTATSYILSRFSFHKNPVVGDMDSDVLNDLKEIPVLQFEIKTRTPFVNALVKQIIPIMLVSLMVYLLLFNTKVKKGKDRKSIGIENLAALLFILVLSHIDFRKTLYSPTVTYLEFFYFVMYFLVAFIAINIVLFDLGMDYIMIKDNNKWLKRTYWPFKFFVLWVLTLLVFY